MAFIKIKSWHREKIRVKNKNKLVFQDQSDSTEQLNYCQKWYWSRFNQNTDAKTQKNSKFSE